MGKQANNKSDNVPVYEQPEGTVVNFGFRLQKSSIPTGHSFKKELASIIAQTVFCETTFANQAGRDVSFDKPKITNKKEYSDVIVEGRLGGWIEWNEA